MNKEDSLLVKFENLKGYYYDDFKLLPNILEVIESEDKAFKFILDYSKDGYKGKLADCFKNKGNGVNLERHRHSVSLYYLGCYLKEILIPHLPKLIKYTDEKYVNFDNENDKFLYIWYLTCLYHDLAFSLEKEQNKYITIDNLSLNDKYNVFRHRFTKSNNELELYYKEKDVNNYFKYRHEDKKTDHGIYAGYKLFEEFKKNYIETWKKHEDIAENNEDICNFTLPNHGCPLRFNYGIIDNFAIVAQTIMCHNIWMTYKQQEDYKTTKENYIRYGLNELIIDNNFPGKKINIDKWSLLFFLDLLDTIEPIKAFMRVDSNSDMKDTSSIRDILKNISMEYVQNQFTIKVNKELQNKEKFKKWRDNILDLQNWLDLEVEEIKAKHVYTFKIRTN